MAETSEIIGGWGIAVSLIRWIVLAASTVIVVFIAGVSLKLLWSREDQSGILVRPFVVVDPSGNLKNAETGFGNYVSCKHALATVASSSSVERGESDGVL